MYSLNICVSKRQAIALLLGFLMTVAVRAENPNRKYVKTDAKRGASRETAPKSKRLHKSSAFLVAEIEPNNTTQEAQVLTGASPLVVSGNAEVSDDGELFVDDDDLEDLFRVTTTATGITITLDNFTSDCDLWLIDPDDLSVLDASLTIAATEPEVIDNAELPAGTYLIGVTIFDPDPLGPDNTPYELTITGEFGGGTPGATPAGTLVYHQITSFSESQVAGQGWQHVLSDNGGHVVWYKQRNPKGVFTANADGSNIREVANLDTGPLSQVDISADGSRIAYIGSPPFTGPQVHTVNADGSNDRILLALNRSIGTLRLTGDGSKVFVNVSSDARIQGSGDLIERGVYSINLDSSGLQQVVGPASIAGLLGIAASDVRFDGFTRGPVVDVSFDGARFVFVAKTTQTGERHVFTANGDGSGVRRIFSPPPTTPIEVGMSRNGAKVAFIVTVGGNREGYTSNFDGSQLLKIASNEQFFFTGSFGNDVGDQISLTADGSKVIFNGSFGHLFNSDGSGVVQLSANAAAPAGFPLIVGSLARATMSSDGARVLFSFKSPENRWQLATLDINPASLGEAPALTDITVNPDVVAVNGASNATIRVKVSPANNVSYVGNVALLNGLRDSKVTNRRFFDDGVSAGDDVAGDGIFTHNAISAFSDAEIGPRILRITAEVFSADSRLHGTAVAVEPFAVVQNPPVSVETPAGNIPNTFSLSPNYPNPFNPETRIDFVLPNSANIRLVVFNLLGQQIRTLIREKKGAGTFSVVWDGRMDNGQQAASGVYIYRLQAERFVQSRKLLLLR